MDVLNYPCRRSPSHGDDPTANIDISVSFKPQQATVYRFVERHELPPHLRQQIHIEAAFQVSRAP
eukprot:2818406-Karenia_brevis.AAC.1